MAKDNYILQHKTPVNIYLLSVATVSAAEEDLSLDAEATGQQRYLRTKAVNNGICLLK